MKAKFKVGDMMYCVQGHKEDFDSDMNTMLEKPNHRFHILEIVEKTCYAGTQVVYVGRLCVEKDRSGYLDKKLWTFSENELTPFFKEQKGKKDGAN